MKRAMTVAAVSLGLGLALSSAAAALSPKDLVGSWTLVAADAYGPNPKGAAMFDANGRFSSIFLRGDLPKYAANSRTQATPAESKATVDGSIDYFGTYSVTGTDLIFHIEGSTFPNWTGGDQKRVNVTVTADELTYMQPTPSGGGSPATVVWRRAK
jgi:hypothetical protein